MPASYPVIVKTFIPRIDLTDVVKAIDVNELQEEIVAIESNVGLTPKVGSWSGTFDGTKTTWASLSERVQNLEVGVLAAYNARVPSGGSTGQVLVKNSNSNFDLTWSSTTLTPVDSISPFLLIGC